ncbi:LacI family DNA-binding transcriptional regulator [bacterium]|nr:LacI family DNA-binding transcriptional regulator [bacterium]
MGITQAQIAKLAGVSRSTVSRVLSGKTSSHKYKPETIQKILDIAEKKNYQPNLLARNFFLQRTETVGMIITDITNPFWASVSYTIENTAHKHNYNVIQCNTNERIENEIRYIDILLSRKADGLIICPAQKTYEHLKKLADYPFVLIDRYFNNLDTDYVIADNFKGCYDAIRYLSSIGHEKIAYIGGLPYVTSNSDRLAGYKQALKDSGITVDESLIYQQDFTQNTGYSYVKLIYDRLDKKPTAIFAGNNMIAVGALKALYELRVKIPRDVSFIMCDDVQDTMNLWKVPITTVRVPPEKLGREAFNLLIKKLSGNPPSEKQHIIIPPDLILRGSCRSI